MDTNFMGCINMTRPALPILRRSQGQIVALSSVSGEIGLGMRSMYCAAKAAVNNFYRTLRVEEPNIRISLMIIDTFSGSNFRKNSLVKADELENRKTVSVETVCEAVLEAADRSAKVTFIP
mmetsp:Transcript_22614/g.27971  ORF Transcript_22614/g.27971 Transcript_22614/m.27971 type:complete len:121 (+) Transcript_22614:382-744(+)